MQTSKNIWVFGNYFIFGWFLFHPNNGQNYWCFGHRNTKSKCRTFWPNCWKFSVFLYILQNSWKTHFWKLWIRIFEMVLWHNLYAFPLKRSVKECALQNQNCGIFSFRTDKIELSNLLFDFLFSSCRFMDTNFGELTFSTFPKNSA